MFIDFTDSVVSDKVASVHLLCQLQSFHIYSLQHMKETLDMKQEDLSLDIRIQVKEASHINEEIVATKSHIKQLIN